LSRNGFYIPKSLAYTAAGLYLAALLIITTVNVVAINYTAPSYTVTAQGIAHHPQYDISTKTWTYTLQNNNQSLGTDTLPYTIKEGDTINYVNFQDRTQIPVLYTPRVWSAIYVNGEVAQTTETRTRIMILYGVWGLQIIGILVVLCYKRLHKKSTV